MGAEPVRPCAGLNVGAAHMEHPQISLSGIQQRVQFAEEKIKLLALSARELQHVPIGRNKGITGQAAGLQGNRQHKKEYNEN